MPASVKVHPSTAAQPPEKGTKMASTKATRKATGRKTWKGYKGKTSGRQRPNDVYKALTQEVIDSLETNVVPWRKTWHHDGTTEGHFYNPLTGSVYKGYNVVSLGMASAIRGYTSRGWLTYAQILKVKARLQAGSKHVKIARWQPETDESLEERIKTWIANGKEGAKPRKYIALSGSWQVFNLDCIDGLDTELLPFYEKPKAKAPTFNAIESAETIVTNYLEANPELRFDNNGGNKAFYSPMLDRIAMPTPEAFETPHNYYQVAYHEMGHSTGHKTRTGRLADRSEEFAPFGSPDYSFEELVAELTSLFLSNAAGIEMSMGMSVDYIKGWLEVLKNDPKMIVRASSKAQQAADYILEGARS